MSAVVPIPDSDPPPRLLLVDDDPTWLLLTSQALQEHGYQVTSYDRAEEALAALALDRPDCVVSDLLMGGLDGFEFCRRVRALGHGASLPILMLTSIDDDAATRRAYDAGASDYCIKSSNWTMLSHRIRLLLRVTALEHAARDAAPRVVLRPLGATGSVAPCGAAGDAMPIQAGHARIYRLSHHDTPTGLPNRAWLVDRLQRTGDPSTPAAPGGGLAILAIDRFRPVSEVLGQADSERLLLDVARRLRRLAPPAPADAGPGRPTGRVSALACLGGEEFGLLLDGLADRDAGLDLCRAAIGLLREPFFAGGREVFLRASVGVYVAVPGESGADRSGWLGKADLARRSASGSGGNRALAFEPAMAEPGFDRLEMERDLHYALQRGEMSMYFQPQFSATTRRLIGFEALMRWARQGTMQPAGRFIPLAEETGLIVPLGEWAISEACAALAAIRALGHEDCVMSVNLSAQQLRTGRLAAVVAAALATHRVPAGRLEVELTESGMMQEPEVAVAELKAVRALGVGLAVDDFGTGYSSLAYLTRLPLTTLKIDRSFVHDIPASARSLAVARAIVALGENLQLRVVAEGVETEPQRHALLDLGCELQQGYLYGPAVPLDEALRRAERPDPAGPRVPLETLA